MDADAMSSVGAAGVRAAAPLAGRFGVRRLAAAVKSGSKPPQSKYTLAMRRVFLALLLFAAAASAQRLPPDIVPSHYKLDLDVDLAGRRFRGEETIDITTAQQTRAITLNSLGLTITRAAIDGTNATVETNEKAEQITLNVNDPLA